MSLEILIAEDNPKDFEFLVQLLEAWEEPVNITRAASGQTALEIGTGRSNPLVISDIQMPELNGIDFARQLWEQQPQSRIVFWSQFKDEMYIRALVKIRSPGNRLRLHPQIKSERAYFLGHPHCPAG